jgi:hypothetical protein
VLKRGRTPHEIEFAVSRKQQPEKEEHKFLAPKVSTIALEKAKEIAIAAGTRWDIYVIEEEFYTYMKKAGLPRNLEAAFIGFVKKKVAQAPE